MGERQQNIYGLLTADQVFGEDRIGVIETIGAGCAATDLAILLGADVSGGFHAGGDSSSKGRSCRWLLSSAAGYGDVCVVKQDGSRAVAYPTSAGGIRPVMACSDPREISGEIRRDISGLQEAACGEYPQFTVERSLARTLENELGAGRLRKTGKTYMAEYTEYAHRGRKYVRVEYAGTKEAVLSDGRACREGDAVWLEVAPVSWFWDEEAKLLISRFVLADGVIFDGGNSYDGRFENTAMYRFLNPAFARDLVPSVLREMTAGERAAYEEEIRRAERRRNPYGLKFGPVTEEDIIRGAIESDIAVFLHGPSSEGKSARVKQIDPTCEIVYLRNATPDSLNGRSVYNQSTGEMIDIPPTWYKKVRAKCEAEPDRFHVVFFDEINNALPSIQGMAFNIVLDREVNGLWKLPENARVVAAGNDMQDSLAANQIAAPFFNRFAHVYINTTTDKWLEWARKNHIHPAIYSYIAYRRGETLRSKYDGQKPNADPRKWEMASRMLYATGSPEMLRSLIGEDITDEFVRFCNQPVITLERVLVGDYTREEIDALNTAERYATTMGLSQVQEEHLETVERFIAELGPEFRAVFESMRYGG